MGTFENRIESKARSLGWNAMRVVSVASKFGIPLSETALSKAFNGLKELPTHEIALPLDLLLGRFIEMCTKFRPFRLDLSDPTKAKELLEGFESGRLIVSVVVTEPEKENSNGTD